MIANQIRKSRIFPSHAKHQTGTSLLDVSHLSVRYNGTTVLEDLSFQLSSYQRIAVVGPNGAGKSTLFKAIAGILPASSGQVTIAGDQPDSHICIAYIPQRSQVDWRFPVTVADVVMMGRIGKLGPLRWPRARDWELVHQALDIVGLEDHGKRQIGELSGGQQQRMFIARALAQEAELMLMDEPLTGLDLPSQDVIFAILESLSQHGVTLLVSLHDLNQAAEHFQQVMLLNRRLVGMGSPAEVFTPERLMMAYGGHLRLIEGDDKLVALSDTCCDEGE